MLEKGFRRAELLPGGLTQPWDTRDTEQGPGAAVVCKTGQESSAAPRDRRQGGERIAPGREGKRPRKAMLEQQLLREEWHQQRTSMPG